MKNPIENKISEKYSSYYETLDSERKKAFQEFFAYNIGNNKHTKTDLRFYDYEFNEKLNDILRKEYCATNNISQNLNSYETTQELFSKGYVVESGKISPADLKKIKTPILSLNFRSKNQKYVHSAEDLIKNYDDIIKLSDVGSDTFWIEDQNEALQIDAIQNLIVDPNLLGVVAEYLGTPPILAQISSWVSFPTLKASTNLNVNAQMYHQDKEFTKFIKVFIYLNDVSLENGAHWYIEGSHKDDLASKGVPYSSRINDKSITKYYEKSALKCAEGPSGTMIFGDTSSVHKGGIVQNGYRIMLQIEFCASLLNSPVPLFNRNDSFAKKLDQNSYLHCRLLDNFSTTDCEIPKFEIGQIKNSENTSIKEKLKSYYYSIVKKFG